MSGEREKRGDAHEAAECESALKSGESTIDPMLLKQQGVHLARKLSEEGEQLVCSFPPTSGKPFGQRDEGLRESQNVEDLRPMSVEQMMRIPLEQLRIVPFDEFEVGPHDEFEIGRWEYEATRFARWCGPLYELAQRPVRTEQDRVRLLVILQHVHGTYLTLSDFSRLQLRLSHPRLSEFAHHPHAPILAP
jgi:hypothetical protein